MNPFFLTLLLLASAVLSSRAQDPASVAPSNAPPAAAVTNESVGADGSAFSPEWVGFVRVLKDEKGEIRAVRLVAGDKLIAVDLNEKGRELAKLPKSRKVLVKGNLEDRDGRVWLVVTDIADASEAAVPGVSVQSEPVAQRSTNAAPAEDSTR